MIQSLIVEERGLIIPYNFGTCIIKCPGFISVCSNKNTEDKIEEMAWFFKYNPFKDNAPYYNKEEKVVCIDEVFDCDLTVIKGG